MLRSERQLRGRISKPKAFPFSHARPVLSPFWRGLFYSYNYLLNILYPLKCLTLISTRIFSFRLSISVHTVVEELFRLDSQETVPQKNHEPLQCYFPGKSFYFFSCTCLHAAEDTTIIWLKWYFNHTPVSLFCYIRVTF